jgi:predicted ATPase
MTGALAGTPTLVGRTAELERCDRLLEAALSGRGALLLVSGEAGIGKTALLTALGGRGEARGAHFALGRCVAADAMPAFAPWQELFSSLRRTAAGFEAAPPPFGEHAGSRTAYELRHLVTRTLVEAAAQRPLLLCLDDVHWADPDSLELLWFVARELGAARILLAATFRSE